MTGPGPEEAREQAEEELIERLRALPVEPADEAFRERLRARFVEERPGVGIRRESTSPGEEPVRSPWTAAPPRISSSPRREERATAERPVHHSTPDDRSGPDGAPDQEPRERHAAAADGEALLRALERSGDGRHGAPAADQGFRADLRRCFLTGEFASRAPAGSDSAAAALPALPPETARTSAARAAPASVALAERREREAAARRGRFRLLRGVVVAAAAAALVLVLMRPDEPSERPVWDLRLLEGDGLVGVGAAGDLVPYAELAADPRTFLLSGPIRTNGSRIQLVLPGSLSVELTPSSVVDPRGLVTASEVAPWSLRVDRGEAYVRKHPESRDRTLSVRTLDAEVQVLGTTLGVYCDERITCVCVAEGEVMVYPLDDPRGDEAGTAVGGDATLVLLRDAIERPLADKPFPQTTCPGDTAHDHHVCLLLDFEQRTHGTL